MNRTNNLMRLLVFLALLSITSSLRSNNERANHLRKLKEDENEQDRGNDDAYNDMIVNQSQLDDITTSDIDDVSRGNILTDQVQKIMETAESQAWDFYSHSPSEWTNSQWNAVFVMLAIFSLGCCCLTGCVWHSCLRDDNEDDTDEKSLCRFIRRPRIICRRRRSRLSMARRQKDVDEKSEKSQSTISSGSVKTFHSMEIEDDARNKPLLEKEKPFVKKLSLKGRSNSQQATDASIKTEQCQYSRMEV